MRPSGDHRATRRPTTSGGADTVRATIERRNRELCRWYAAGDADAIARAFTEDCWRLPPHAAPIAGRAALRAFWSDAFELGDWWFTLETQDLVVAGTVAVERGRYRLTVPPALASPALPSNLDRGNYVVLWRCDGDGEWRVVWDAPVSSVPLVAVDGSGPARGAASGQDRGGGS
jgi:ketosteroid isomerase-like protein